MRVLREAFDYPFSRLDPMGAHIDPPSIAVYESLLTKGPDRAAHASLARVAHISHSQLEWTLELRHGARFHSGQVCDSRAVIESLEALRWHTGSHRQLWYWDPVDTVVAVDDRTIKFTLHHPYPRFPSLLWGTHTAIFNNSLFEQDPEAFGATVADGTGPYRLVSLDHDRIVTARVPDYEPIQVPGLRREASSLDRIEWISLLDPQSRLDALLAGDVHVLHNPPYSAVAELMQDPGIHVYEAPQSSSMYLSLNWERTDLDFHDIRLRRAVSAAIDREALVRLGLAGQGLPTWGPLPPGSEFYDAASDHRGSRDRTDAERVLDELGWRRGPNGIREKNGTRMSFDCVTQRDPFFEPVTALVAAQLRTAGIELLLKPAEPFADFYQACRTAPASSISKWLWPDAVDALKGFTTTDTAPFPNWSNASAPELDRAFDQWIRAENDDDLHRAAVLVQSTFVDTLPYIPLLTPNDVWLWRTEVVGFAPSPNLLYPLYQGVDLTGTDEANR